MCGRLRTKRRASGERDSAALQLRQRVWVVERRGAVESWRAAGAWFFCINSCGFFEKKREGRGEEEKKNRSVG